MRHRCFDGFLIADAREYRAMRGLGAFLRSVLQA